MHFECLHLWAVTGNIAGNKQATNFNLHEAPILVEEGNYAKQIHITLGYISWRPEERKEQGDVQGETL